VIVGILAIQPPCARPVANPQSSLDLGPILGEVCSKLPNLQVAPPPAGRPGPFVRAGCPTSRTKRSRGLRSVESTAPVVRQDGAKNAAVAAWPQGYEHDDDLHVRVELRWSWGSPPLGPAITEAVGICGGSGHDVATATDALRGPHRLTEPGSAAAIDRPCRWAYRSADRASSSSANGRLA
jgi:hypothetical protein